MKKTILTATIILAFAFGAAAQTDGFFSNWNNIDDDRGTSDMPTIPDGGLTGNQSPVGSGLLILTALGAGYAVKKIRDER